MLMERFVVKGTAKIARTLGFDYAEAVVSSVSLEYTQATCS
jgi:hypothetical protein